MARVALEDWQEQIRDPKIECMSRDEMNALQSERLVRQVKNVYENVAFYRKKMDDMGVEPGDIKGIEDIGKLPFTTKRRFKSQLSIRTSGSSAGENRPCTGNIRNDRETDTGLLYRKRCRCMGRVCCQRTYNGRT